jgi:hypothetical protein
MASKAKCTQAKVNARAWQLLDQLAGTAIESLTARVADDERVVRISVKPAGASSDDGLRRVGQWLSPTCALIVTKLGGDTLTRLDLARRCGMPCDPKFKTLVTDLIDRGIIIDPDGEYGVRAASRTLKNT